MRHCAERVLVLGRQRPPPLCAPTAAPFPPADGRAVLPWTPGNLMITYTLPGGWVTIRASGTEPKLKVITGGSPSC